MRDLGPRISEVGTSEGRGGDEVAGLGAEDLGGGDGVNSVELGRWEAV